MAYELAIVTAELELSHWDRPSTKENVQAGRNSDAGNVQLATAPGRKPRTMNLASRGASAPVQRKAAGGASGVDTAMTADWMNVAVRPDLHSMPIQRKEDPDAAADEGGGGTGDLGAVPADILAHLRLREGWREEVYLDSEGKPTAGLGHLLLASERAQYKVGDKVPIAILEAWAQADTQKAYDAAQAQASTLGVNSSSFVGALTSVNFQLGTAWNTIHKKTWAYMVEGKWEKAAAEAQDSRWYSQTPVRVQDFQAALRALAANGTGGEQTNETAEPSAAAGETNEGASGGGNQSAANNAGTENLEPAEQSLLDRMTSWLSETTSDVMDYFGFGDDKGGASGGSGSGNAGSEKPTPDFVANGVRGCDYVVKGDGTIVYMKDGAVKREFPQSHKLYSALKAEILEVYPDVPCWQAGASQTGGGQTAANNSGPEASTAGDKTGGASEQTAATKGGGKYYEHPNADKVSISYGPNAVALNADAKRLIQSIIAGAGLSSGYISSTLRTYADQARINYEQNSGEQIKKWYGAEVYNTWSQYKKAGKTTADYAKYLEERDKKRGKTISNHIPGYALDVSPHNSKFSNFAQTLVPVSGSGVRKILV